MGFDTTYIGHFSVTPPLNPTEVEWLEAFAAWRGGPHGEPFRVPMNPRAEWRRAATATGGAVVVAGSEEVPWSVFDWRPCFDGCCLTWHEQERSHDGVRAVQFLVDHLLGRRALAAEAGGDDLAGFTFDHDLTGVVAGVRGDTGELFLIRAEGDRLRHETISPGRDPCGGW